MACRVHYPCESSIVITIASTNEGGIGVSYSSKSGWHPPQRAVLIRLQVVSPGIAYKLSGSQLAGPTDIFANDSRAL